MKKNILFLKDIQKDSSLPPKIRSLAILADIDEIKFNIPNAFILTNNFQKEFFKRNNLLSFISKEVPHLKSDDFIQSTESAKKIREKIISSKFTQKELEEIQKAVNKLNSKEFFAVRSSSNIEDGENESWAGQFDSFLDIHPEDIPEYIKHCWASLFGTRAIHYGISNLLEKTELSFSVIIQEMVHGDYSGVAFTVNPLDSNLNHARIEAVPGTGEAAVSGQETPYAIVIDKNDGLIVKRSFGSFGKIELLKPSLLKKLLDNIIEIENIFKIPVDVEWTIKNENIFILQTRPITSRTKKQEIAHPQNMPNILDYELAWKVNGLHFMFADLLCHGFSYLHPLFVCCEDSTFLQYFTIERMEYASKFGHRWLSTPDGFEIYQNDFSAFHDITFPKMKAIVDAKLTTDSVQEFFTLLYKYFVFYSKTDFQFTNLTYLYSSENTIIADNLKKLSAFKDIARVWINNVSINDDSLLELLLQKISEQFKVNRCDFEFYKISELSALFNQHTVNQKDLNERKNAIVLNDGHQIKHIYGQNALSYINNIKKIETAKATATIAGQVANRKSERFVTGIVRLINVDYANISKMEREIAEMKKGEILISEFTAPELMAACSKAKAIVTDLGGMLAHAAIVSRELGIPSIVGTGHASKALKNGDQVKLDLELGIVEKF